MFTVTLEVGEIEIERPEAPNKVELYRSYSRIRKKMETAGYRWQIWAHIPCKEPPMSDELSAKWKEWVKKNDPLPTTPKKTRIVHEKKKAIDIPNYGHITRKSHGQTLHCGVK